MNIFDKIMGVIITLIISVAAFFMGVTSKEEGNPLSLYQVYLNGEDIGLIKSKETLLNLIDEEQRELKEKYDVDKVYPPSGLDIQPIVTYDFNVKDEKKIYEEIKDKEPFTISGYKVTIKYVEPERVEENYEETTSEVSDKLRDPITLNVLHKEDFENGIYDTMAAFIGKTDLDKYKNGTQSDIVDVGEKIESVRWNEDITIKEDYLSTDDYIYTNSSDISKYLLFGTLKTNSTYKVKAGEDISKVAFNNNLNVAELLIANPEFSSDKVLLTEGQEVNTTLIDPLIDVVYEVEKVEDVEVPFQTDYEDDKNAYVGNNTTIQEGVNGETRLTETIKYINGEIQGLVVTNRTEITPAVNEIVKRGTKVYSGGYVFENTGGNETWQWPTIMPYVITSRYEWRWGRMHEGIDISGTGYGSPIFAVAGGTVAAVGTTQAMGNYIIVDHHNNYYTIYMHLHAYLVSAGQEVTRGQHIGAMGNTGNSTGTHLHLGVYVGYPYRGGVSVDPCRSIYSC